MAINLAHGPDRIDIKSTIDRYIAEGPRLRERLAGRSGEEPPLSLSLQRALYDERGLPR